METLLGKRKVVTWKPHREKEGGNMETSLGKREVVTWKPH